ncbi:MAG: oligosaccharide flippase family protein [Treponema sp.]|nr:oligosaccharide flippase family protein [Treponema sp.]
MTPKDYGIVAIVTVFTTFFTIQDKTLTGNEVNNIFSFSFYVAFVLVVIFCLFGQLIAWFYRDAVCKTFP